MAQWLLLKRGYYFRPKAAGYTSLKEEAGRFDDVDSLEYVVGDSEGAITRVPVEKGDEFAPEADAHEKAAYWKRKALEERHRADGLQRRVLELEGPR